MDPAVNVTQNAPGSALETLLERALDRAGALLAAGSRIGVAASGGPDSTFLLEVVAELARRRGDPAPTVLHVDHGWRGAESRADAAFVRGLAERLALPCQQVTIDPLPVRSEDRARRARYAALHRLSEDRGLEAVATGHHRDDQIETVVLRLLRGTGLRGLAGMPVERPLRRGSSIRLVRPLLELEGTDIREWLRSRGISSRTDSTNRDPRYARNAVRHELLPRAAQRLGPLFGEHVLEIADRARLLAAVNARRARAELTAAGPTEARSIELGRFNALPRLLRGEVLRCWCEELLGEGRSPELAIDVVERFLEHRSTRGRWSLGRGLELVVEQGHLRVREGLGAPRRVDSELSGPGRHTSALGVLEVEERTEAPAALGRSHEEWIDAESAPFPWRLRTWQPGDRFQPLGMDGRRKLKDFLSDRKVGEEARREVLLLECARGPIWIVGHRLDHRRRVTPSTRRWLRLSWEVRVR